MITGASSGIGLATAEALARAGAKVALVARSADKVQAAAARMGPGAIAVAADLTAPNAAVADTPKSPGSARGLRVCPWIRAPANCTTASGWRWKERLPITVLRP